MAEDRDANKISEDIVTVGVSSVPYCGRLSLYIW